MILQDKKHSVAFLAVLEHKLMLKKNYSREMPHTCLVFVFLQHRDSFFLESFNSLVCSLGFVVKIVSLVQSASHLSGVQLEMDYPEHETAVLVVVVGRCH